MRTAILTLIVATVSVSLAPPSVLFGAQAPASLQVNAPQANAPQGNAPQGNAPQGNAPQGNAENGKKLFVDRACWQCHGTAAQGGGIAGPRLAGRVAAWPAFTRSVRRPAEEMVPYTEKMLPEPELADIYAWLKAMPPPPPVSSLAPLNRK